MKKTSDVWNDIIDRPADELTPTENVVHRVNKFLFNFETGNWLYNLSPAADAGKQWIELRETADCVAAVGAPDVTQHLRDVVSIVEGGRIQDPGTWNEFMAQVDPSQKNDQIEKTVSKEIPDLWDKLAEYTLAHFECEPD